MAISLRNAGTWAVSSATTQTVTLPTHQAGDMLIVRCGRKSSATTAPSTSTSGWTRAASWNNGSTISGNGTGHVSTAVFYKEATSNAEPSLVINWTLTATPGCAVAMVYQKGGTETWATPVASGCDVSVATTSWSGTGSIIQGVASGDLLDFFVVVCDDTTMTVPSVSMAGVTLDTVVESPATALSSTTSDDISADGGYRLATAGSTSSPHDFTETVTLSTTETGTGMTTRLRVTSSAPTGTFASSSEVATSDWAGNIENPLPDPVPMRRLQAILAH